MSLVLLSAGGAWAHGGDHGLDDQLVAGGQDLLLGDFTAPQPGPLVVVPHSAGPLGCVGAPRQVYRIALSEEVGVMFAANDTQVQLLVDWPAGQTGYAGFAVDTHGATRALLMMQENAVALHALVGVVHRTIPNGTMFEAATGTLGVPYLLDPDQADGHGHAADGSRPMLMAHDGSFGAPVWCEQEEAGHVVLAINRSDLPDSLAGGSLVHVVALVDPVFETFLPRALADSTLVLEANLYLARQGEDPERVRAALDPAPSVHDVLPLAGLAVGIFIVAWRPRPRP